MTIIGSSVPPVLTVLVVSPKYGIPPRRMLLPILDFRRLLPDGAIMCLHWSPGLGRPLQGGMKWKSLQIWAHSQRGGIQSQLVCGRVAAWVVACPTIYFNIGQHPTTDKTLTALPPPLLPESQLKRKDNRNSFFSFLFFFPSFSSWCCFSARSRHPPVWNLVMDSLHAPILFNLIFEKSQSILALVCHHSLDAFDRWTDWQ